MVKPQPYPGDRGLPSFHAGQSLPSSQSWVPRSLVPGPPQWSSEVGDAVPGSRRRPGKAGFLSGSGRILVLGRLPGHDWGHREALAIHSTGVLDIHRVPGFVLGSGWQECTDVALFMKCRV